MRSYTMKASVQVYRRIEECFNLNVFRLLCIAQSIEELEKEMLNGQKLQGPATAAEVNLILKHKNLIDK